MLLRLVGELRPIYVRDTIDLSKRQSATASQLATDDRGRRALRRLNVLALSAITRKQFDSLSSAGTRVDSLSALAGERNLPDDPTPRFILEAIRAIGSDREACNSIGALVQTQLAREASAKLQRSALWQKIRIDSAEAAEQTLRVSCALREVRERAPARFLGSIRSEEEAENHPALAAKLDTLMRSATAVVILRKLNARVVAPVTSREQSAAFWRQRGLAPLNIGSISGSSKSGVAFTELASPLLRIFRVSVNAVLAADKDANPAQPGAQQATALQSPKSTASGAPASDEPVAAIQRLLTGGGLFNVSFAWPALHKDWFDGSTDVMMLAVPRFGLTAPILGASSADSSTLNLDVGVELHAKVIDLIDGVGLVAQARFANTRGSRNYVESLGVADRSNVSYATASFGFMFGRQYLITASRAIGGPKSFRSSPWQVGLTVVRLPTSP